MTRLRTAGSSARGSGAAPTAGAPPDVLRTESGYFDGLVTRQGEFDPFDARGWATLAACFARSLGGRAGLRLLDVGCGTGQSRQLYASHCASYVGLDLSQACLGLARGKFPRARWVRADAGRLPFPDASFTAVAFSSVLHHLPDFGPALREARRVLAPGGAVFAFDPNVYHPAMLLFRHPSSPLYLREGVSPNERPLRPSALRRAFAAAGFVDVRQHCQSDIPYREVAPRVLNSCLKAYNVADRLLQRSGLARWLGTFVVTAARAPGSQTPA